MNPSIVLSQEVGSLCMDRDSSHKVDIISVVIEHIPLVESEREDRSWESTIGTDLITVLIEYDISLWIYLRAY